MNRATKIAITVFAALVVTLSAFAGGFLVASVSTPGLAQTISNARDKITDMASQETTTAAELSKRVGEVETLLDRKALDPSTLTSATAGAINGLLESTGDKWAAYFPPVESEEFSQEMSGSFSGIGVVLAEKGSTAVVSEVYPDTPAQAAGVLAGDQFIEIDGKRQKTWTSAEVSKLVRGKKGTDVTIVFLRDGKEIKKTITRDDIQIKNMMTQVYDNVGYMMMSSFNANSTKEVAKAIEEFDKQGVDGYVLDLRYNPGGLLDQSINIGSLFLNSGDVVVKTEDRNKNIDVSYTTLAKMTDKPLVVIVNGHSASASEVLAGALKDHDRAILVGEKTFGKGSVQEVIDLTFGGSMKFTTSHWLTPDGNMIDGKGIIPDITVANSADKMKDGEKYSYKKDAQLQRALSEVKKSK